jgi:uncharacterized membrane protein (DUF4010 family)
MLPRVEWPYVEALLRISLGISLGLLIGLERERSAKEAGLRTFSLIALLGALGGLMGESFAIAALALTALLTVFLNARTLMAREGAELTTSAAMLLTAAAGILCGQGHRLTPAAVIVSTTALLAWKRPLAGFSQGLTEAEVRSAIVLAVLAIVIYPALPEGRVGPMSLIEPRAAWITVLLIAGIGFVNYILWKLYGARGADIAGFLGGLVNSSVTVSELASRAESAGPEGVRAAYRGILLATAAMLSRNIVLLGILAPPALVYCAGAFAPMLLCCAGLLWRSRSHSSETVKVPPVALELPFSLTVALKYGLLFLVLTTVGSLTLQLAGSAAFYSVSFLGGLFSSASAVASAAGMVAQQTIDPWQGAIGALVASMASVLVNVPFILRARNKQLMRQLTMAMALVVTLGAAGMAVWAAAGEVIVSALQARLAP